MTAQARTYFLVGGAIAAPWLFELGAKANIIPVYLTDGQRAAMDILHKPIAGVSSSRPDVMNALGRWLEVRDGLAATRGGTGANNKFPKATVEELQAVLDAFLAAAHAGYMATVEGSYQIQSVNIVSLTNRDYREELWTKLAGGEALDNMTALGDSVFAVVKQRRALATLYGGIADTLAPVAPMVAAGNLANEMDEQGYRITGKPTSYTLSDAFDAAKRFWADKSWGAFKGLSLAAAEAAMSSAGAALLLGYLVYRWTK